MDFEKMKREDFLDSIYGINEVNTETIPVEQKKFLSGGFYFLQEFFKKQLALSESFQKLLHFEANRNDIDFHKYYCIEIELYNSFFAKFPSAKEETEYFLTEEGMSCTIGAVNEDRIDQSDLILSSNDISLNFIGESNGKNIHMNIDTKINRFYKIDRGCLASITISSITWKDKYQKEYNTIFSLIFK